MDAEIDEELRAAATRQPDPPAPKDWIDGSRAVRWGAWVWPVEILNDVQAWGDQHCCRFILVSEVAVERYSLVLYVAPKPNRKDTGLCALSIENRDRNLPEFRSWLEGYLAGRGIIRPGQLT